MTALDRRQCGACTVCCTELKIQTPELAKKAGTACGHLMAGGCSIYDSRPPVCRQFLCGWRLLAELDDGWRPDRSGVLALRKAPAELPAAWRHAPFGVEMNVIGGEAAVTRPGFAEAIAALLARGVPVQLSARSPSTILNEHLDAAGAARDLPGLRGKLLALYRLLHAARWSRGKLGQIVPLYRLQLDRQTWLAQERLSENR
jgi:hypothetical protein